MEIASSETWRIKQAGQEDIVDIGHLLAVAPYRHLHADWHLPVDWIGTPGFLLCERESQRGDTEIAACLAVGADPAPAAWVRVAALRGREQDVRCLGEMLSSALPWLQGQHVSILGWLSDALWPEQWLTALGFQRVNWIVTYSVELGAVEISESKTVTIRPATVADMAQLAEIEREAFEPLWRHSQHGLMLAYKQAVSFDVAELDGRIAGFQYSVAGPDGDSVHLVRLTVTPEAQTRGVGSGLMQSALNGYERMGAERVTLNTQADNEASHRLYERFGFRQVGGRAAVWAMSIG